MFDASDYGSAVAAIIGDGQRLAELGPGSPDSNQRSLLKRFNPMQDLGPVRNVEMAKACHSGLWLYHDFLDESHTISQDLPSTTGSFWHAIMHRREPDAWNSNYWWRRVGPHPVLKLLADQASSIGYRYTDPSDFVAFCETVRGTGGSDEDVAKKVQLLEWQLLFDHCFRAAVDSN